MQLHTVTPTRHFVEAFKGKAMKEIPLTKGLVTLVDDEDYESLICFKWCSCSGYAGRKVFKSILLMHSQLMQKELAIAAPGTRIDHIDRNRLNNQKYNLRLCTIAQNNQNLVKPIGKSGYRGVRIYKDHRRPKAANWCAYINANGKNYSLGYYNDAITAARAYDAAAKKLHGDFAVLNFPGD